MKYRYLAEGEIVQEGDEVDMCNNGWKDEVEWEKAETVGIPAPNPSYPSHRVYRRLIVDQSDIISERKRIAEEVKNLSMEDIADLYDRILAGEYGKEKL